MRSFLIATSIAILMWTTTDARADGLFFQLPEDGAWVEYEVAAAETNRDDSKRKGAGSLKISSVGTETVGGTKCRWIEIESVSKRDKSEPRTSIWKLLIPEKHLHRGETPHEHIVRAWAKRGNRPAREIDKSRLEVLLMFLTGPPKASKTLKPKIIETKAGKLKCAGLAGELYTEVPEGGAGTKAAMSATVETRLHKKAPFGVAWCKFDIVADNPRTGKLIERTAITLKLSDEGTGAVSELTDAK